MLDQQNRIRACRTCPNCLGPKDQGLVVCWPCNRKLKARHNGGYGNAFEFHLDALEHFLAVEATRHLPPTQVKGL